MQAGHVGVQISSLVGARYAVPPALRTAVLEVLGREEPVVKRFRETLVEDCKTLNDANAGKGALVKRLKYLLMHHDAA